MFEQILRQAQERVRSLQYVLTKHAADEMDADGLTVFDIESIVLTGQVVERQRDTLTSEWKYLIQGDTMNAQRATVVARLSLTGTVVFITVYREDEE